MLKKSINSIVSKQVGERTEKMVNYITKIENRVTELEFLVKNPQKYKRGDLIGKNVITGVTTISQPFNLGPQRYTHAWMYTIFNAEDVSLSVLSESEVDELVKKNGANKSKPPMSDSNFIIKIDDAYCEWEYGFTIDDACIDDFIKAIEEKLNTKCDYKKMIRSINGIAAN